MPAFRLRLLGTPVAEAGGKHVEFRPERSYQLLAYLAARQDWVRRDELAHLFWPDQDNASARRNLRFVLHSAKGLPAATGLASDRERVRFAPLTDLTLFETACAESRFGDAIELYRGPFLSGLDAPDGEPFSDWLRSARDRLAANFRNAAFEHSRRDVVDDHARAVLARRLLEHDPYDEAALRQLLGVLAASGRADEARRAYREFSERLLDEMGLEPSAETRAIARRVDEVAPAAETDAPPPPLATSSFVGRKEELDQVRALLAQPECRLLTMIGPGGIGKSRLAAEFIKERGAAAFVALESLRVPSQIPSQVAKALGLALKGDAEAQVVAELRDTAFTLVLDNFEHLIDGAQLVSRWLDQCPRLQLIVTSRERLEIAGEWIFRLEGLSVPGKNEPAGESSAVSLFVERARRNKPDFDVERERGHIRDVVSLVDGMPLAIELAAAWTRLLPCADLAKDLRTGIDLLVAENDTPSRARRAEHQSIRACFDHSWSLLMPRERDLLGRLSVFHGGFSLEALRQIAHAALPALASLIDKSLVRTAEPGRFALHPLLRRFAGDKLRAQGPADTDVKKRHASFFLGMVGSYTAAGPEGSAPALAEIDADFENCVAAWHWALEASRFDLLESAAEPWAAYLDLRCRLREALDFFSNAGDALGAQTSSPRAHAHVERARAYFLMRLGRLPEAQERAHAALRDFRSARDRRGILLCVNLLGMTYWQRGEYARARTHFQEGLKDARADGDVRGEWRFAMNLALAHQTDGQYEPAHELFEQALANARRRDNRSDLAMTLNNLGNLCVTLDDGVSARKHLLEAFALGEECGNRIGQPYTLINLAIIDIGAGEHQRARWYVEQALDRIREGADRQVEPMCLYTLARIECARGEYALARKNLGRAARIALETQNVPNMIEVAIWTAEVDASDRSPERAAEKLAVVLGHPRSGLSERKTAQARWVQVASQLSAEAQDRVREAAGGVTLEAVIAQIAVASEPRSESVHERTR